MNDTYACILKADETVDPAYVALTRADGSGATVRTGGDDSFSLAYQAWLAADNQPTVPPPASLAQTCTDIQGRLALKAAGLLQQVEDIIAALPVTDERRIWWDRALTWREDSQIIAGIATALGVTPEQKTALFAAARAITV